MSKNISELGFLSVGSQLRRVYEKLQLGGDKVYATTEINFKSSWFPIYYTLANTNTSLSIKEITDQISYSRITVKNIIKELAEEKLVEVKANPIDARSKLVKLSAAGNKIVPELEPLWNSFSIELEHIFNSTNHDFMAQLDKINQSLDETSFEKRVLKNYFKFSVHRARKEEFAIIGKLLIDVYGQLKGFPNQNEQPEYYQMLGNVGQLIQDKNIDLLVARSEQRKIGGVVIFFRDMKDYGSGGTATKETNACGFRLLAVDPKMRGLGLGKLLTMACIQMAEESPKEQLIIHSTKSMKVAWKMYEDLGFIRSNDLDFMQGDLPVFGFRLKL